jgi:hypothetical protein
MFHTLRACARSVRRNENGAAYRLTARLIRANYIFTRGLYVDG